MSFMQMRQFGTTAAKFDKMVKTPIPLFGTEGRYVSALFSAASKQKKLDVVEKELKTIQSALNSDKKLRDFVLNPTVKKSFKRDSLMEGLKKQNFSPLTVNFFGVLAENGRLKKVDTVFSVFNRVMSAHRGEVQCEIVSAKALDEATMKDVQSALQAIASKGQVLQVTTKVDPSLIGGLVISIGDRYVDMSLATKIKNYSNAIKMAI